MPVWMMIRTLALIGLAIVSGCEAIATRSSSFQEARFYTTADGRWGTTAFSALFCPDGRVDMTMSDFGVQGRYELARNELVIRTPYNEIRYQVSRDRSTLTPVVGEMVLTLETDHTPDLTGCSEGVPPN